MTIVMEKKVLEQLFAKEWDLSHEEFSLAEDHRDFVIPHLIAVAEEEWKLYESEEESFDNNRFYTSVALLSHLREPGLFPLLLRLYSHSEESIDEALHDCFICEELSYALANCCNGRVDTIMKLSEDAELEVYLRIAALEALKFLVARGHLPREELVAFLQKLLDRPFQGYFVDHTFNAFLVITCSDIWPYELLEGIKRLFAYELVERQTIDIRDVYGSYHKGKEKILQELTEKAERELYLIITKSNSEAIDKAIASGGWSELLNESVETVKQVESILEGNFSAGTKVGRNDSCPCGSGKKYKKCCSNGKVGSSSPYQFNFPVSKKASLLCPSLSSSDLASFSKAFSLSASDDSDNIDEAMEIVEELISRYPQEPYLSTFLFNIYQLSGMHRQAELLHQRAFQRFPDGIFVVCEEAIQRIHRGEPDLVPAILQSSTTPADIGTPRTTFHVLECLQYFYAKGLLLTEQKQFEDGASCLRIMRRLESRSNRIPLLEGYIRSSYSMDCNGW